MTKGDQAVESAADRLERFVRSARASGGVKAKVGDAMSDDAEFLRKLKPSLIKARARGRAPTNQEPSAPSSPQLGSRPKKKRKHSGKGPPPLVVVGAALVAGVLLAKVLDWRGHAHPRD
jgi:hypothetical protein